MSNNSFKCLFSTKLITLTKSISWSRVHTWFNSSQYCYQLFLLHGLCSHTAHVTCCYCFLVTNILHLPPSVCLSQLLRLRLVMQGFIRLIWTPVLSSDWSCSLWNSGSLPGVFLAYVSCFLYRSEWSQFIVSYRWRTHFEIRYHSLSGFCWLVCSTRIQIFRSLLVRACFF